MGLITYELTHDVQNAPGPILRIACHDSVQRANDLAIHTWGAGLKESWIQEWMQLYNSSSINVFVVAVENVLHAATSRNAYLVSFAKRPPRYGC